MPPLVGLRHAPHVKILGSERRHAEILGRYDRVPMSTGRVRESSPPALESAVVLHAIRELSDRFPSGGSMEVQRLATRALAVGGILLLVVAAIHLAVTPVLRTLFLTAAARGTARFWLAPFLLNHVVVGILLVPVGLTTLYAARAARAGAPWARAVALTNAFSILALPVVLVVLMGREYFGAGPFLVATALVAVASVVLVAAALALRPDRNAARAPRPR